MLIYPPTRKNTEPNEPFKMSGKGIKIEQSTVHLGIKRDVCNRVDYNRVLLAVPRRLFCFGSLVILDVARCYLWLFTLYIKIKIGKNSC